MSPIDLLPLREAVGLRDLEAGAEARLRLAALATPRGSLGRLEVLAAWLAGAQGRCPPGPLDDVRVVLFVGDHGVARGGLGDEPRPTAAMLRAYVGGRAAVNALARLHGARVRVLDVSVDDDTTDLPADVTAGKIRRGSGSIDHEDALTQAEVDAAFALGARSADEEIDSGADLLIAAGAGAGSGTVAAALVGALVDLPALDLVGTGRDHGDLDDGGWARKIAVLRDALYRSRPHRGDPLAILRTIGGADLAAITGFLVQAAARRTPVLLDGVVSGACALAGRRLVEGANQWWLAGDRSTDPAQHLVLDVLGLEPLVDLGIGLGEGAGALTALPVLRAAQALLAETALLADLLPRPER
jgi:nicotinate-nucleotide--dimethylbenzimidazole phosphoribosyltransferase